MKKHGAPLTYTDPHDNPVLSQRFTLDEREREVAEVRDLIVAEGVTAHPGRAGLLALPALPHAEPAFIEWLTCGLFTIDHQGFVTTEPDVLSWLTGIRETGRVF